MVMVPSCQLDSVTSKVFSNLNESMILWFCNNMKFKIWFLTSKAVSVDKGSAAVCNWKSLHLICPEFCIKLMSLSWWHIPVPITSWDNTSTLKPGILETSWGQLPGNSQARGGLLLFLKELTNIIGHKIWRKALGSVAHGGVIVSISSKHQHGPTHYHSCVQVAEKSAVFQNSPSEIKTHVLVRLLSTQERQNTS